MEEIKFNRISFFQIWVQPVFDKGPESKSSFVDFM